MVDELTHKEKPDDRMLVDFRTVNKTKDTPRRPGRALAAKPARPKNPSIHTVILDSGASESIYTPEVFDKHVKLKSVTTVPTRL